MTNDEIIKMQQELIRTQQMLLQLSNPQQIQQHNVTEDKNNLLFRECADYYMRQNKNNMRKSSYANAEWLLKKHILPYWGNVPIKNITNKTMQEYIDSHVNEYAIKTVKDFVAQIKTILNFCATDELITFKVLKVRYPKIERDEYVMPNLEEINKMRTWCVENKDKNTLSVLLAIETGMRIGEICGLKWEDIDLENKVISINKTVQRICNNGTKSTISVGPPKTASGNRKIPISDILHDVLFQFKSDGYLYVSSGKVTPNEPRTLRQYFDRLLKKIGLPHYKFHSLRHNFATRAIANGIDPKTVASILGHSNCDITLNIYTSVTNEMMNDALTKMNS